MSHGEIGEGKFKKKPEVSIPNHPQLEEVLNVLLDYTEAVGNRIPIISSTSTTRVQNIDGRTIAFHSATRGNASEELITSLKIVDVKPDNVEEPVTPVEDGYVRIWVTLGSINSVPLKNWKDEYDFNVSKDVYVKVTTPATGSLMVTEFEVDLYAEGVKPPDPVWLSDGTRPVEQYAFLGTVSKVEVVPAGVDPAVYEYVIWNDGSGSITMSEQTSGLSSVTAQPDNTTPCLRMERSTSFVRRA